jgi:glycosyltransferase involved in cell wall biosynthesis
VRELALDGVFFVGWRDHDHLRRGFGCADLMVAPSVDEAFGSVYLEAMAAGLPVVATASGTPGILINRDPSRPEGWLAQPDDEHSLTDILLAALTVPGARSTRAAAGLAFARSRFSWQAIAQQVATTYEAVRR